MAKANIKIGVEMPDRITVSLGVTRNMGNFESARVDAQLSSDVREDETLDEAWERLWVEVDTQVEAQLDAKE